MFRRSEANLIVLASNCPENILNRKEEVCVYVDEIDGLERERMIDVEKAIATVARTGKVLFGTNNAIRTTKIGKAKLIVLASNCPENIRRDIEYYSKLSSIPIFTYKGTSIDLGAACGKPFTVSALTIREEGDSDILKLVSK